MCPFTLCSLNTANVSEVPHEDVPQEDGPAGSGDLGESLQNVGDQKGSCYGMKRTGKKKNRGHNKFERMESLVEKMTKLQEESDDRYVKLEAKCWTWKKGRMKKTKDFRCT